MTSARKENLLIAGALAGVLAVLLPFQTCLGNLSAYRELNIGRVLLELDVIAIAIFAVAYGLLAVFNRLTRGILGAVLASVVVCVYLESGPLSFGLPEINGGYLPELFSTCRGIWDTCAWVVVLAAMLACVRWARSAIRWTCVVVCVMSIASLFDVRCDTTADVPAQKSCSEASSPADRLSSGFEWQLDVISNFKLSRGRNVLMFILDSMPGNVSTEKILSAPDLAAKFPGFVAFTNNVGMHDCTKRGLPGLMTGEYFDPVSSSPAEYPISIYGSRSFLMPFADAGWEVSFAPDFLPYGFTTAKVEKRAEVKGKQKHGWAAILRRSHEVPYLSLFDATFFRIVPYVAKAPFLYAKIRHDPMFGQDESNFWYEHVMYPMLASAGFTDSPRVLGVFHSRGAHPPLAFDKDGNRLPEIGWGRESLGDLVLNPLHNLGKLMDSLREKGVYDKSFIVVVADHGVCIAPFAPEHHPSESAILWVKPEGASAPLSFRETPTGYSRISALMRAAAERSLDANAAEAILHEENRLFRYQDAVDRYHDIVVGPDGGIVSRRDW